MRIERVRPGDPEGVVVLDALRREYEIRYGAGNEPFSTQEFDPPHGAFIVVMDGDVTVAGGGICRYSDTIGEVKRVWTHPDHRRKGHAVTVLAELQAIARELGYERVRLETGYAQPEALALYRRLGFTEIGNYGHYARATGFERILS